jgi:ribosomal-protein-serine acetyltransferase
MFRLPVRSDLDLRLVVPAFAEPLYALVDRNREHLGRWLPWVSATTSPQDTGEWIRLSMEQFARNEGWQAALCHEGRLAGCIGFKPIDWANLRAEIGYWLAAEFQGRGLMTDAARAAVDHAFREWRLNRVEVRCAVDNHRSAAIPRRLGFSQEGLLRKAFQVGGEFQDLLLFGLLRDDWKGLSGTPEISPPCLGSK